MTIDQYLRFDYNEYYAFNDILEKQAQNYGGNVLVRYQLPNKQEFKSMTYAQAHRIASNLAYEWAPILKDVDTVTLLADHSIYYLVTMLAIFKLNASLMTLSPSNTAEANINLLNETGSNFMFVSEKYSALAKTVPQGCGVKILQPFNLERLDTARFAPHKATVSDIEKTVLILHSSGTTALPKPVRLSNRYMVCMTQLMANELQKRNLSLNESDVMLPLLPLFHMLGAWCYLTPMLFGGSTLMFSQLPPSPRDIVGAVESLGVSILVMPPVMLNHIAQYIEKTQSDALSKIKTCIFGGAALSKSVGEYLSSKSIKLTQIVGSTEIGGFFLSRITEKPNQWQGMALLEAYEPYAVWEPVDEAAGIFHLLIKAGCPTLATGISNRANGDFASNDLFKKDQLDPGYWHYIGRSDNMLVMENGKKANPTPMEDIISEVNIVHRCVVIGTGRQCTAALIELKKDQAIQYCHEDIVAKVYEAVEQANQAASDYSRIFQSMVYILPLDKQLPATTKGTVIRKQAISQYEEEIDKMYKDFLEGPTAATENDSQLIVVDFLYQAVTQVLRKTEIDPNTSFFDYGLNSLLAIQLRNRIATRFKNVPSNFVFENPTLVSLAEALTSQHPSDAIAQREAWYQNTQDILVSYLERANVDFPIATSTCTEHGQHTVLLTGATGSLGAFMLRDMILSPHVKKIYCLVRGRNLMQRVETSFKDRHLDVTLLKSKVEVLPMKLNAPYLGWDEATYNKLKNEVTIVQHCAWLVDFNQPVQRFDRECICGMYNLLKFAYRETNPIHVHFISSISATAGYKDSIVPEEVSPQDPHVSVPLGYAQSKYVVEHLLNYLAQQKNFPCTIERMGQVCGDTEHGVWNTSEQYPLIMVGGAQMGLMPDLQNVTIDWLPVDIAAASIVDIMLGEGLNQGFFHIVNPQRATWSDVLKAMRACEMKFQVVKPEEWVQALSKHQDNPAYRLMAFFEANFKSSDEAKITVWKTDYAIKAAPRLREAPPFGSALLQKYLAFWRDIGFYAL